MSGLGLDLGNPRQIRKLMTNPDGIADLLQETHEETGDSPAEIFADLINIMRADTARLAAVFDIDHDVKRMTPERAAQLLGGTVGGDGAALVEMFNDEAERRDEVLQEALDDDEYDAFMRRKRGAMFTGNAEGEAGDE